VPFDDITSFSSDTTQAKAQTNQATKFHAHLNYYLHDLTLRPNEPPYDLTANEYGPGPSTLSNSTSMQSIVSLQNTTPESDSFIYLEHVLESLAVLGKLGVSLDTVSQRLPIEIFNLVEVTLSEVGERLESSFRSSLLPLFEGGRPSSVFVSNEPGTTTNALVTVKAATNLRLTVLEQIVKEKNKEILRDLFWTLFSKLDAVVQGLRVVSEVANRIASVCLRLPKYSCQNLIHLIETELQREFRFEDWGPLPSR
jgi:exocyst complex component 4